MKNVTKLKFCFLVLTALSVVRCGDGVSAKIDRVEAGSAGGSTQVDKVNVGDLKTSGNGNTSVQKVEIGNLGLFGSVGYALFETSANLSFCNTTSCTCSQDKIPTAQQSLGGSIVDLFKNMFAGGTEKRLLFNEASINGRYVICSNVKDSDLTKPEIAFAIIRNQDKFEIKPKDFNKDLTELKNMNMIQQWQGQP